MQSVVRKKVVLHFVITDVFSGAESVCAHIIKDLPFDWEGYYVAPEGKGCQMAREMGIKVIPLDTSSVKNVKRLIKDMKPDAVHAHDCRMSLICALSGFPFVSHLHANWKWMEKICPQSILLAYACKKATAVLCVSKSIKNNFVFPCTMKNNGVVLCNTVNKKQILQLSSEIVTGDYDLCFVGRLTEVKQPLLFVELVSELKKKHPEISAVMIGDGELIKEIEEKIAKLSLKNNIHMTGYEKNPYKYMKKSKIGVVPSSVEGFGLVAVEEMLLGLPVVSFNVGGLTDIVSSDCGLLCSDISQMSDEITRLLTEREYYIKKSLNAEQNSQRYTDRDMYIKNIVEKYERR